MISFTDLCHLPRPLIIAHRGASGLERENTLPAFRQAVRLGADAIECDVRRTADGVLVIHHNRALKKGLAPISRLEYADCLRFAEKQGYHIPTLKETLRLCTDRIALDIELKEIGYEEQICNLIAKHFDWSNVAFTSFKDAGLVRIRQLYPGAVTGLLIGLIPRSAIDGEWKGIFPVRRLTRCGADFVAPHWRLFNFGLFRRVQKRGIPVIVWTVNQVSSARRLLDRGVTGIITNHPDRLQKVFEPEETKSRVRTR